MRHSVVFTKIYSVLQCIKCIHYYSVIVFASTLSIRKSIKERLKQDLRLTYWHEFRSKCLSRGSQQFEMPLECMPVCQHAIIQFTKLDIFTNVLNFPHSVYLIFFKSSTIQEGTVLFFICKNGLNLYLFTLRFKTLTLLTQPTGRHSTQFFGNPTNF